MKAIIEKALPSTATEFTAYGNMTKTQRLSDHVPASVEGFLIFGQDACDAYRERIDDRYAGILNMAYGYSETFPPVTGVPRI